jgi:hypothetical protein
VGIGEDVAVRIEDEAGCQAALLRLVVGLLRRPWRRAVGCRPRRLAEEAAQELGHVFVRVARSAACLATALDRADVDDSGADLLDQVGEVGQALRVARCRHRRREEAKRERKRRARKPMEERPR